jgi:hypothetical protein
VKLEDLVAASAIRGGRHKPCASTRTHQLRNRVRFTLSDAYSMTHRPAAVGTCVVFSQGYGEFLARRHYAIVAISPGVFYLVEIDLQKRAAARILRKFARRVFAELELEGIASVQELPAIPRLKSANKPNVDSATVANSWVTALRPLIDVSTNIFSDENPVRCFNRLARRAQLHQTRARERFFWLAAYGFDEDSLTHAYWNSGVATKCADEPKPTGKRGRKVKEPDITPSSWPFDLVWVKPLLDGWKKYARLGTTYRDIYLQTLRTKFGCLTDTSVKPARLYQPNGFTYPTYEQFRHFIQKQIGRDAWLFAKFGQQTIRNRAGKATSKVGQYLINLLEEVHWDAQILDELPGDLFDPSQPGKPIVRVVAVCATCGGPVGVGYDYGSESQWAYLMALLCMAMKKSEFGELFGVEISDEEWPAIGLMLAVRGDRGPAIGQKISDIIAQVLEIWQQWAASYDPVGKPNAEAGHYKKIKVEGAPIKQSI